MIQVFSKICLSVAQLKKITKLARSLARVNSPSSNASAIAKRATPSPASTFASARWRHHERELPLARSSVKYRFWMIWIIRALSSWRNRGKMRMRWFWSWSWSRAGNCSTFWPIASSWRRMRRRALSSKCWRRLIICTIRRLRILTWNRKISCEWDAHIDFITFMLNVALTAARL